MISPEQLAAWKDLANRSTIGPWSFHGYSAAARTAVPLLIAEVERLREAMNEACQMLIEFPPPTTSRALSLLQVTLGDIYRRPDDAE